jgi:hypothetical protein
MHQNQPIGLAQRSASANNRAKPLQASTNIIHTKIPRRIENVIQNKARQTGKQVLSDPIRKEAISARTKSTKKADTKSNLTPKIDENDVLQSATENDLTKSVKQTDENDVSEYVKNAYNPLDDIYGLDEELYQKVLKLEIADDGLPTFKSDEPFDF